MVYIYMSEALFQWNRSCEHTPRDLIKTNITLTQPHKLYVCTYFLIRKNKKFYCTCFIFRESAWICLEF